LLMGFRPEAAQLGCLPHTPATQQPSITVGLPPGLPFTYQRRELLGAEQQVYLAHPWWADATTTLRCAATHEAAQWAPGTVSCVTIPLSALHWFNADTQERLFD
jgi:hypothetical protein